MHIRPIRTDEDHETTLREIEALWGADEGTDAGDRLDVLATLVETYERRRWPIEMGWLPPSQTASRCARKVEFEATEQKGRQP